MITVLSNISQITSTCLFYELVTDAADFESYSFVKVDPKDPAVRKNFEDFIVGSIYSFTYSLKGLTIY